MHRMKTSLHSSKTLSTNFSVLTAEAYSGTLNRREIVRANASLGELRRVGEKWST